MNRKRIAATALALTGAMTLTLTGCAGGSGGSDDKTLRIAMGSPGEAQIARLGRRRRAVRGGERGLGRSS